MGPKASDATVSVGKGVDADPFAVSDGGEGDVQLRADRVDADLVEELFVGSVHCVSDVVLEPVERSGYVARRNAEVPTYLDLVADELGELGIAVPHLAGVARDRSTMPL